MSTVVYNTIDSQQSDKGKAYTIVKEVAWVAQLFTVTTVAIVLISMTWIA